MLRYIHQNPLKAGLATNVFACKWTSINEYVGKVNIVDIDSGLDLFASDRKTAIQLFIQFMQEPNDDECLDYQVKMRMPDSVVKEYLYELGITNPSILQRMEKETRNTALAKLKELNGVTIRQLSRITGISKSAIQRVR